MADFSMFAGDTKVLEVTVKDEAGAVVDISGTAIRWQLAKSVKALTPLLAKAIGSGVAIIDGPAGRFDVTINNADTELLKGAYYYEAEIDDGDIISTVLSGTVQINQALIKAGGP